MELLPHNQKGDIKLKYFKKSEFECPCCGRQADDRFMELMDDVRRLAAVPFVINSGKRCPAHNDSVGGKERSAHVDGLAADIKCHTSHGRFKIINSALSCGITRIGVYKTFIHLDISWDNPPEVIWYG